MKTAGTRDACVVALCVAASVVASMAGAARADDAYAGAQAAAGVTTARSAGLQPEGAAIDSQQHIKELVQQLGSPRYALRRAAASELRQIGPEAFDQLYGATDDADPEIAASARYLLQQIPIHWARSDDSPLVRRMMRGYGSRGEEDRSPYIEALARLPSGEGTAALCRIARFERSPLVSRTAALALIRPDEKERSTASVDPDVVDRELGRSTRTASAWLRQWLVQQHDPAASLAGWQRLVDEELQRLDHNSRDTSGEVVAGLLWNMVNLYHRLGQPQPMMETVDRMMTLQTEDPQQTAIDLIEWFAGHRSWEALDEFLAKHQRQIEGAKRPLYVAALARAQQGRPQLAEKLAAQAAEIGSVEPFGGVRMALDLYVHGQFDWSVREYRSALQNRLDRSPDVMPARIYLAEMLHDHQQDRQAAEALQPLVTQMENDRDVAQLYERVRQLVARAYDWVLPERESVFARYHYYQGCDAAQRQDWAVARGELQSAIKHDETDADVVIAMYRVAQADDAWRAEVHKRIDSLARLFQQQIDEAPGDKAAAIACNQWAWLVANTEGDYDKAVAYSRRSLELMPDTPSFLDTLGRCCYAAGDIKGALKYQRQAIEKMPYMQVMQRQLATFEEAAKKTSGAK